MLYTPLLPEAASGTLEPRHVVVPLRVMCPHAELLLGTRHRHLDEEARAVRVDTEAGPHDVALRAARASRSARCRATLPVPGLARARAARSSRSPDAIRLRNHVLRRLEAADAAPDATRSASSTFVFVGAGYAGVEALAELSDLVRDALRYYPRLPTCSSAGCSSTQRRRSSPEIPPRLGEYAAARARASAASRSTSARRSQSVDARRSRARRRHAHSDRNARLDGRREARTRCSRELGLPLDDRGRVGRRRAAPRGGARGVWVARRLRARAERGDAGRSTRRPASTRSARRGGSPRTSRGDVQPYRYRMLGQVATLGRYKGIADVLGLRLRGFPGWFVTRSYHLYQLPLLAAQAARRDRLDGLARLPPGRRRARDV